MKVQIATNIINPDAKKNVYAEAFRFSFKSERPNIKNTNPINKVIRDMNSNVSVIKLYIAKKELINPNTILNNVSKEQPPQLSHKYRKYFIGYYHFLPFINT